MPFRAIIDGERRRQEVFYNGQLFILIKWVKNMFKQLLITEIQFSCGHWLLLEKHKGWVGFLSIFQFLLYGT